MPRSHCAEYETLSKASLSDREVEASVLTLAATKLRECQNDWNSRDLVKLDNALKFNQMIWTIIQADLIDESNTLPKQLKENLLNLSLYIDKRTFDIMAYPEPSKLTVIIDINLNIAAGLRGQ